MRQILKQAEDYLSIIATGDYDSRSTATLNLMYLMENSTKYMFKNQGAEIKNSDEFLSQDEQAQLIERILSNPQLHDTRYSSLIWVIGKADPLIMITPLQQFILHNAQVMHPEILCQALVALENCMRGTPNSDEHEATYKQFQFVELKQCLNSIERSNERLSGYLDDALGCLKAYENEV